MPDIFNRNTDTFGGSFAADDAFVTFPALQDTVGNAVGADVGLLIQRLQISYQQQITRLYEVGRATIYYVGGRTNGDIGVDRVIGPRAISENFYKTYGDMCRARRNTLNFTLESGCGFNTAGTRAQVDYTCHFCVVTTVGVNVAAADMIINESIRIMFSSLLYLPTVSQQFTQSSPSP
jgi:hypothetical protein